MANMNKLLIKKILHPKELEQVQTDYMLTIRDETYPLPFNITKTSYVKCRLKLSQGRRTVRSDPLCPFLVRGWPSTWFLVEKIEASSVEPSIHNADIISDTLPVAVKK